MCSALADDNPPNGAAALRTGLATAPVNSKGLLEATGLSFRRAVEGVEAGAVVANGGCDDLRYGQVQALGRGAGNAVGQAQRVQPGAVQGLVHVDVPQARHESLVQEQGLQRPPPPLQGRVQPVRGELLIEGLRSKPRHAPAEIWMPLHTSELAHINEAQPPAIVQLQQQPVMPSGRFSRPPHLKTTAHAQVTHQMPSPLPAPLQVQQEELPPPPDTGDARTPHTPPENAARRRPSHGVGPQDAGPLNGAPFNAGAHQAHDGLDFRQFGHGAADATIPPAMRPLLVLDVVGLTPRLLGEGTPNLVALARRGASAPMAATLPAVTLSAQATMLTGTLPSEHGAVGNGWLDRESGEVALWRQSNALVKGQKVYETARQRNPDFTCAKLFWWWNMGAAVDFSLTPRPYYPADGRKIPAIYSAPTDFAARTEAELGPFPFFDFWGPRAGLPSSAWIAEATLRALREESPTLTLAYLPHLDYDLQRHGPDSPAARRALGEVDALVGRLVAGADAAGAETMVVSEYGIEAATHPVHINRTLRRAGLLAVRETPDGEVLDPFASRAFAVSDHQVAHIYTRSTEDTAAAAEALRDLEGVDLLLGRRQQAALGLAHERSGDIVAVAAAGAWFTYYYWLAADAAPDFATTVDIHRKPGYDPCEMLLDPSIPFPRLRVARRLLQKRLGFRTLLDVIPLDASLVQGSHGRLPGDPLDGPIFISSRPFGLAPGLAGPDPQDRPLAMTSVADRILSLLELDSRA